MTIQQADSIIRGKVFQIGNIFCRFEPISKFIITIGSKVTEGHYDIVQKEKRCYLRTDPAILDGDQELSIDVILGEKIILLEE